MREAEFYGAMDGASKFVRGDAIAGLIITAINLVGGIVLGLMRHMPVSQAIQTYSILSVGDGLVSQIPALIVATASGILVTKATTQRSLGREIGSQVGLHPRPLMIGAAILLPRADARTSEGAVPRAGRRVVVRVPPTPALLHKPSQEGRGCPARPVARGSAAR